MCPEVQEIDIGWGNLIKPRVVARFSVIRDAPAPESNMALALAVRLLFSRERVTVLGKAVSIGGREGEGGVEGMSTTTAALVVVGVAEVVAEDSCSRSRWRREWCLSPQWRH